MKSRGGRLSDPLLMSLCGAFLAFHVEILAQTSDHADLTRPKSGDEEIIVTGQLTDRERLEQAAQRYARMVEAPALEGQMARWNRPLCPTVSGVQDNIRGLVASRITALARRVGAPVAGRGCRPNLVVSFTADARGLLAAMERRDGSILSMTALPERRLLRESPLPIRWWYVTTTEGADGRPLFGESAALGIGQSQIPTNGNERFLASYRSTMIETSFRVSITSAVVLVDVNAATGFRLDDVSDYVAFVALTRVRVAEGFDIASSILALFSEDPPGSKILSDWDVAYLDALDRAPASRTADVQRNWITGAMVQRLSN